MKEEPAKKIAPEVIEAYRESIAPKVLLSLVRGIMKGVFELDEEARNRVLKEMAWACYDGFREFLEQPATTPMDIDSACEWLKKTVPHERCFHRTGDTVIWDEPMEDPYGGCMCPLVRLGLIEPRPELCVCSTLSQKRTLEELTGIPMEAELVESVNTGFRNCLFRFHLKPTVYSSKSGK